MLPSCHAGRRAGAFGAEFEDGADGVEASGRFLKENTVCLHEAAFEIDNFYVRTDILCKEGNKVKLIEVKAKSFDVGEKLANDKGGVYSAWKEYVYDLAFQYWVVKKVHPDWEITPYLLLLDKGKNASVEGLYQRFPLMRKADGSVTVIPAISAIDEIGESVFYEFDASGIVRMVLEQINFEKTGKSFEGYINELAELSRIDKKVYNPVGKSCKGCEFVHDKMHPELLSGMDECWQKAFPNLSLEAIQRQKFFEVNSWKKDVKDHKYFLDELEPEDIDSKTIGNLDSLQKMSLKERQWQQVRIVKEKIGVPIILKKGLKEAISTFKYPFNFIDFETFAPPLPFNKGRRPYEMLAFQFSHHILYADGTVVHANEWINTEQGLFPNFQFVRKLKAALEVNDGTVFRYADHENTVLNAIKRQLNESFEPDKAELLAFISTITNDKTSDHVGERNMIDLCEMVKDYYIHSMMKGSKSLKVVLPAMLNSSQFLQDKYKQPVYGSEKMNSLNYSNMVWAREDDNGLIMDPYKLLDPLLDKYDEDVFEAVKENIDNAAKKYISDGGAAMMAYAEMQFAEMQEDERKKRIESLKKYCELDTLAMVMVMEGFINF